MKESLPPEYLAYLKLFNQEKFFEAHEVLETLWRKEKGEARDFYQGLIQIAAVFVHLEKKTPEGAERLLESASGYLKKYPSRYMRLDLCKLFTETRKSLLAQSAYPQLYLVQESTHDP